MISVLLPFRNAAATLHEAATSVRVDLGREDELLLLDDGSTDGGSAIATELARSDARVRHVRTSHGDAGVGIARALGVGLDHARGDIVARMDGDDVSLPGRFLAQRALLFAHARTGVVGCQVDAFPSPGAGMQRYVAWQNGVVSAADHARAIFVESPLCHPSTMIRRDVLARVGPWRDGPFAEDYDLWLRIDAAGIATTKVPTTLFRWRIHGASLTWTDARYSALRLRELRATHLAIRLARIGRPFLFWGAGKTGRRLARALETHGAVSEGFLDIDPSKIGRTARGRPILGAGPGMTRAREHGLFVVVAVGAEGARDVVRGRLDAAGFVEGEDYVCAS